MVVTWRSLSRQPCPRESIRERGEGGFTLLEMIIVCVLIGLMLSLAVPTMRNAIFTDPLKSSSRKIIGLVSGVRELAVRNQQPFLLHINEGENRLWFEKEVDTGKIEEEITQQDSQLLLPDTVKISGLWIGGDQTVLRDNSAIWISKQGYMQRTAIRIENDDGDMLTLQFFPFLDSVEISDQLAGL